MTRPIKRSSTSSTTSMPSLAGVCPNGNVDTIAITGQPVTSAYVALPHLPPDVPGDLALVWDHHQGWAVTIEPRYPPPAVAYHSDNVLLAPAEVVAFVHNLLDDHSRA